jgi:hypothetical protein
MTMASSRKSTRSVAILRVELSRTSVVLILFSLRVCLASVRFTSDATEAG